MDHCRSAARSRGHQEWKDERAKSKVRKCSAVFSLALPPLSLYPSHRYIANWKESMRNLAAAGITTICYDFMPVVNWTRTQLDYRLILVHSQFSPRATAYQRPFLIRNDDDSIALAFDYTAAVAFDAFVMKREGAEEDYSEEQIEVSLISASSLRQAYFVVCSSAVLAERTLEPTPRGWIALKSREFVL